MKESLPKVGRRTEIKGVIRTGTGTVIGKETEEVIGRGVRTGTERGIGKGTEIGTGTVTIEIAIGIGIAVKEGNGAGIEMMMIFIEAGTMTGNKQTDVPWMHFTCILLGVESCFDFIMCISLPAVNWNFLILYPDEELSCQYLADMVLSLWVLATMLHYVTYYLWFLVVLMVH